MNRPIDIVKCAICGSHHRDMLTYPLVPTVTIDKLDFVRYGICPDMNSTIYLAYDGNRLVNIKRPETNFPESVKVKL